MNTDLKIAIEREESGEKVYGEEIVIESTAKGSKNQNIRI